MEFLQLLTQNWSVIVFLGGLVFNLGMSYAWKNNADKRLAALENTISVNDEKWSAFSSEIKSINVKLDLLLNDKIKRK